jgi:Ty3 transposon capsid-like protein/Zinc knuckle
MESSTQQARLQAHIAEQVAQRTAEIEARLRAEYEAKSLLGAAPGGIGTIGGERPLRAKLSEKDAYRGTAALDVFLSRMLQLSEYYGIATDDDRVRYAAAHLQGPALQWWQSLPAPRPSTWELFVSGLRARFQPITTAEVARARLDRLEQGRYNVQAYVSAFQALIAYLPRMDEADKVHRFVSGLAPSVRAHVDELAHTTLPSAIERAVRYGSRQQGRVAAVPSSNGSSNSSTQGVAMELDVLDFEDDYCPAAEPAAPGTTTAATDGTTAILLELRAMREALAGSSKRNGNSNSSSGNGNRNRRRVNSRPPATGLPTVPHLSTEQVKAYMETGKCFSCGRTDHQSRQCPNKQASKGATDRSPSSSN